MSDESMPSEPDDVREITGIVKWFNAVKGFGFVTVADSSSDAFLHLSVLRESGFENLLPGATVRCDVADRIKGLQVTRIHEVDESTAAAVEAPSAEAAGHKMTPSSALSRQADEGVILCPEAKVGNGNRSNSSARPREIIHQR